MFLFNIKYLYQVNILFEHERVEDTCFTSLAPTLKRLRSTCCLRTMKIAAGRSTSLNKPYVKNEYTILLCASCIIFIVKAANYCIVSLVTHFSVS